MAVDYHREGDVAVITMARPEAYNAIDQKLSEGLVKAVGRAGREARALVLHGSGKAFSSGADLRELEEEYRSGAPDLSANIERRFNPLVESLAEAAVPTVAAVNGVAAGAGMSLALACDLRVMSTEASFMSAFINVALIPDSGASWYLVRMLGLSRALELTYSGRRLTAQEAADLGLAHRVVEPDRVLAEALEWATRLCDGPTEAYVATRRLLVGAAARSLTEALAEEQRVQGQLGSRPAHLEGVAAFTEKRRPDFRSD